MTARHELIEEQQEFLEMEDPELWEAIQAMGDDAKDSLEAWLDSKYRQGRMDAFEEARDLLYKAANDDLARE